MYMQEPYVSFKIAKILKEKGFDWFTFGYYTMDDYESTPYFGIEDLCADNWNGKVGEVNDLWFSAPTQQMACRWLREEKGIHIYPVPDLSSDKFCVSIAVNVNGKWRLHANFPAPLLDEKYIKCEDAVEAALEYCLINLI